MPERASEPLTSSERDDLIRYLCRRCDVEWWAPRTMTSFGSICLDCEQPVPPALDSDRLLEPVLAADSYRHGPDVDGPEWTDEQVEEWLTLALHGAADSGARVFIGATRTAPDDLYQRLRDMGLPAWQARFGADVIDTGLQGEIEGQRPNWIIVDDLARVAPLDVEALHRIYEQARNR